jgi:mannonate dehydratase
VKRRRFLSAVGGTMLAASATGWLWPDEGFLNPCLAALPRQLAEHELVRAAWEGIDPQQLWDCHAHLVGTGDSGSGTTLSPQMHSLLNPIQFAQRLFFLNAGCVHDAPGEVDRSYVERMHNLLDGMRPGCKLLLLPFDRFYDESGAVVAQRTTFHVPDIYARETAHRHPQYFEWAASIHPYRSDCLAALASAVEAGARAVKWLPAAQGMDPASPRCDRFYVALACYDIPLITHAGEERAVHGGDTQHLGNPVRLRRALDHGVRVVVAHCASMGEDRDLDRGENGPYVESFQLFSRLMDEARHQRHLFGDISAMTQRNRAGPALRTVIERSDWHPRLLNGSDYPLPGVMPLFSLDYLVDLGLIPRAAAPVLSAIRRHNPLLFDFVLKRHLTSNAKRFNERVFQTRAFFQRRQP